VRVGLARSLLDLSLRHLPVVDAVPDVLGDGAREEARLLPDVTDVAAQPLDVELPEVHAVQLDAPALGVVEAFHQVHQRALARAARAHQRHRAAGVDAQGVLLAHLDVRAGWVGEVHSLHVDVAGDRLGLEPRLGVGVNDGDAVNHLQHGPDGAARLREPHRCRPDLAQRHARHLYTQQHSEDVARAWAAVGGGQAVSVVQLRGEHVHAVDDPDGVVDVERSKKRADAESLQPALLDARHLGLV